MSPFNKRFAPSAYGHLPDDVSVTDVSVRSNGGMLSLGGNSRNSHSHNKPRHKSSKIRPLAAVVAGFRGENDESHHHKYDNDDEDISATTSQSSPHEEEMVERMEMEGKELLMVIRRGIATQIMEKEAIGHDLSVHVDRSKARYISQNTIGSVLSMRKVKSLQARQAKIMEAIEYLMTQEEKLRGRMEEARAMTAMRGFSSAAVAPTTTGDRGAKGLHYCDLSSFRNCSDTVDQILAEHASDVELVEQTQLQVSDEELLQELKVMVEEAEKKKKEKQIMTTANALSSSDSCQDRTRIEI
ncbi:hypothetical protein ACA910_000342 [Epithemia clementina (nom. ined.)]